MYTDAGCHCVVYILEGVRIADLLEVADAVIRTLPQSARAVEVFAKLACEMWLEGASSQRTSSSDLWRNPQWCLGWQCSL
jgi:hypothetical protein